MKAIIKNRFTINSIWLARQIRDKPSRWPAPDNPGNVLYYRPADGQKTNYSINGGITATISVPLDRSHVKSCLKAAEKQVVAGRPAC